MAESDGNAQDQVDEESRLSLLNDALDQASKKIMNKILRYWLFLKTYCVTDITDQSFMFIF